ncbi:MAG TPA: GNAT family N-acetyltransferase [Humisphaera sp.]|jgi:ribosomal protein S18 acetylase RimI-like enzyme|nr:GNAT family N-acetyltransferase [Humisphaera sp.]
MDIRPVQPADLNALIEIDGTVESSHYLHVDRSGEGLTIQWKVEERPLRTKWVDRNRPSDELQFLLKQIASGVEEGIAVLAEHDGAMIGLMLAQPMPHYGTMRLIDIRIDYDFRRQGLASGMLYQLITEARNLELRAVTAEVAANNEPACRLLLKLGFDLAGLDTQRHSNHDLVKEAATLLWYASLA